MNRWERDRGKTLFIVEGHHEKNKLFSHLARCYPELKLKRDRVEICGINIYALYGLIKKEYGEDWKEQDIDLPWLVSGRERRLYKTDFINILLVFDYERHDPQFSEEKIEELQSCFCDAADMGKLYINYPMVESYEHLYALPDPQYETLKVSVSLRPGSQYKQIVRETALSKVMEFPARLSAALQEDYHLSDDERDACLEALLGITGMDAIEEKVQNILKDCLDEEALKRAAHHLPKVLNEGRYLTSGKPFWPYLRDVFSQIILHNIRKASLIQNGVYSVEAAEIRDVFSKLNETRILKAQNEMSRDPEEGFIWVLNMSVLFVAEYDLELCLPSREETAG